MPFPRSIIFIIATLVTGAGFAADAPHRLSESITITGAVEQPLTLSVADLQTLNTQYIEKVDMVCMRGIHWGTKEDLQGVLLRDILEKAQLKAASPRDFRKMVFVAKATDDYKVVFSWGEVFNAAAGDEVMVYYGQGGEPLSEAEGLIALITPTDTRTGPRHVKWLNEIEVVQIAD